MFDYQFVNDDGVLFSCDNTQIEFDRLSPPTEAFVLNNQMFEDIKSGKYSTRFQFMSDLENEDDGEILNNMYNFLKTFEAEDDVHISIQVKFEGSNKYSTIIKVTDINYVACVSRYDTTAVIGDRPRLYNQVIFLCNPE